MNDVEQRDMIAQYEELKKQSFEALKSKGLSQDGDNFTLTRSMRQQMIVNGQHIEQVQEQTIRLECLGMGSIDYVPMIGFSVYVDNVHVEDFWTAEAKDIYRLKLQ